MVFIVAGMDTVSNTLSLGTLHIIHNPVVRVKLCRELEEVWPDLQGDPPSFEVLEKLPYLVCLNFFF